ncbi:HET-domain-containing protein, partial [Lepidopterella palustris CBS 459.81]
YEAMSYSWGSKDLTEEIIIDGKRHPITHSAHSLLKARRSVWKPRTIWVDAICINQKDDEERSHQVTMMKDIYEGASRVIIWLGGGWKIRLAARLAFATHLASGLTGFLPMGPSRHSSSNPTASSSWNALVDLIINNPYFSRVWVIQEVAVGRKVYMYCGGFYIPWEGFMRAFNHWMHPYRIGQFAGQAQPLGTRFGNIGVMSDIRKTKSFGNLAQLLCVCQKFVATEQCDKIFALLGLASDGADPQTAPRYGKKTDE